MIRMMRSSLTLRRRPHMTGKTLCLRVAAFAIAVFVAASAGGLRAGQVATGAVAIDNDDIGGVVTGQRGPEAGVWVIAETTDLPTRLIKSVVTDDQGRYLLPDLPKANYRVWVRGYGLVDSAKGQTAPGKPLDLKAVIAPSEKEAAQYYPAAYWYSLLHIPPKSDFPGTGQSGNGISDGIKEQGQWVELVKTDGCESCHQLGDKATREIPSSLGAFDTSAAAWDRRIQSAQVGNNMVTTANRMGRKRAMQEFGDWTDRVKAGELPPAPPRPQGLE